MTRNEQGFTILEVLVAVLVLAVGVIALVGSSALVTRMIGQGKRDTRAAAIAEQRLETLRQQAYATTPACTALVGGTTAQPGGITDTWEVAGAGNSRTLRAIVTRRTNRGTARDTVITIIRCG